MIVADSTFIIEGILKKKGLLEEDLILTPDLAIYKVANAIWKHQYLLKDLDDGVPYLSIFHGLLESERIRIFQPNEEFMKRAYSLAARNSIPIYDAVFVSLALEASLELKTSDKQQAAVMRKEATS